MMTLDDRIRAYVDRCEPAVEGCGGHDVFFAVAVNVVLGFDLEETAAVDYMTLYSERCEPPWSATEIRHKVSEARHADPPGGKSPGWLLGDSEKGGARTRAQGGRKRRPRPTMVFDEEKLDAVLERVDVPVEAVNAWELGSRSAREPSGLSPLEYLRLLYPAQGPDDGAMVLVFSNLRSQGDFVFRVRERDVVRDRERGGVIAASLPAGGPEGVLFLSAPVDGVFRPTIRGTLSRRMGSCAMRFPYMLLESDVADVHKWVRLVMGLPLPVASIALSGRRSVHVLLRVDAPTREDFDRYKREAARLLSMVGADKQALTAVVCPRLPNVMRGSRLQRLLYVNPEAPETPLFGLARRWPDLLSCVEGMAMAFLSGTDWPSRRMKEDDRAELLRLLSHYGKTPGKESAWAALRNDVMGV